MTNDFKEEHRLVDWFSHKMLDKLAENADKPHWHTYSLPLLVSYLEDEITELKDAIQYMTEQGFEYRWVKPIIHESADVANFAAMIADLLQFQMNAMFEERETP